MKTLNLWSLEDRRLRADHNILLKLMQSNFDAPHLLEHISHRVPAVHTRSPDTFHVITFHSNFLSNDPFVGKIRSLNDTNDDIKAIHCYNLNMFCLFLNVLTFYFVYNTYFIIML